MKVLYDHRRRPVRLTDERLAHILEHPEMVGMESEIDETLREPEAVIQSRDDAEARLYYRYLTDKLKRGEVIWSAAP